MPTFAQKEMHRYGWSEGKGLGRTENGMKTAIKVKLKNNTGGLGHDQGAEFSFHWWDHIFNKAASSFKVNESEDGVQLEKCEGKKITPLLISNKRGLPTRLGNKSLLYGTFVKAGTYNVNKTETSVTYDFSTDDSSDDDDDDEGGKAEDINDTLQQMFLKTGLTGHKAARHGHSLNGKLQRLMKQEELQLSNLSSTVPTDNVKLKGETKEVKKHADKNSVGTGDVLENKKTKKKIENNALSTDLSKLSAGDTESSKVKKKKKKKQTKGTDDNASDTASLEKVSTVTTDMPLKVKKRKQKLEEENNNAELDEQPKKKKKKKKETDKS